MEDVEGMKSWKRNTILNVHWKPRLPHIQARRVKVAKLPQGIQDDKDDKDPNHCEDFQQVSLDGKIKRR